MNTKKILNKLFSPLIWVNMLVITVVVIALCILIVWWMQFYTKHGESIEVPNLTGMTIEEAEEKLDDIGMTIEIIDSTFNKKLPQDMVLEQKPKPGTSVKTGRTIYLTINTHYPPTLPIPDVINNCSYREAEAKLRSLGFKIGNVQYVSGNKNWVYGIKSKGRSVTVGERVELNSPITLVIGNDTFETNESGELYEGYDSIGPTPTSSGAVHTVPAASGNTVPSQGTSSSEDNDQSEVIVF